MGYLTWLDIVTAIVEICVIVVIIAKTIKLTINTRTNALPFFFALSLSSYLLSSVYWIAYDFLKPDTRMPMACNEICECAVILLLCAGLDAILKDHEKLVGEILFAILFTVANIALWIAWSGEWLQDILFGIPYIYFIWLLIRGLKSRECLSRKELWLAAAAGVMVLAMQLPQFFVDGIVFKLIEGLNFVVMLALTIWIGIKSFRCKDFFLAATFFLWTELFSFLNANLYYYAFSFANLIALLVMYSLLEKEIAVDG
ncbi:hypothetical protein [Fibrobacter sp.]|uniref:hypothetical protein n=1 Tax=Fibrobacter sp. TaxID=35828 RepID=UPI00388D32D7